MIETIRQAVTRVGADQKSEYAVTGEVPVTEALLYPGAQYWLVWGTDDGTAPVGADAAPVHKPFFPGPGGTRFIVVRFAPNAAAGSGAGTPSEEEFAAMREDAEDKFPGLFDAHASDPAKGAFHTTDTVDYAFVAEGELVLELDNGVTETLVAGSCVVQRGTRHAWHNNSDEPALVVFVMVGAERVAG
jgi:hypothetical protein